MSFIQTVSHIRHRTIGLQINFDKFINQLRCIILKVTVHENCKCPQTGKLLKTELKIHHHYDTQNGGKRNGSTHKIRSKLDGLATRTHLLFSLKTLYFLVIAHSVIQSFYVFGIKYRSQAKNMADS